MLLFNREEMRIQFAMIKFPYIPCYCSTKYSPTVILFDVGFHTSHVTVQQIYKSERGDKPVRFHTSHVTVQLKQNGFKIKKAKKFPYIPCYCSTPLQT